ncbi:hypothetical protein [Cupriavidus basilensis]
MSKNSTGAKQRQSRNQAEIGQVLAFPTRPPAAVTEQGGQIVINLRADGMHDARLTGGYAEDLESAIEALELVWQHAASLHHPVAPAVIAQHNVLNFPSRRMA